MRSSVVGGPRSAWERFIMLHRPKRPVMMANVRRAKVRRRRCVAPRPYCVRVVGDRVQMRGIVRRIKMEG